MEMFWDFTRDSPDLVELLKGRRSASLRGGRNAQNSCHYQILQHDVPATILLVAETHVKTAINLAARTASRPETGLLPSVLVS
jgi:hypothetical protein